MISKLRKTLFQNLINFPGWTTSRRFVVIESDDWGTIRMSSQDAYKKMLANGISVDKCAYAKFDSLESNEDLTSLFEVLYETRDKVGNPAVITANTIVANPDFEKIRQSDFRQYYYEPFTTTMLRYPNHSFDLWKEGMTHMVFRPQFHGREHVNVHRWMNSLQGKSQAFIEAFNHDVFGLSTNVLKDKRRNVMAALDIDSKSELGDKQDAVKEGLKLFEAIFQYKSLSFIAPSYTWNTELEPILKEHGVLYLQGNPYQKIPVPGNSKRMKFHYTGQKNNLGQRYLVRNAYFEPTLQKRERAVDECLKRIEVAFRWNKPAIIGSHRLNFIGSLDTRNRDENLALLRTLLKRIVKTWPQVEFVSSDVLGKTMDNIV